VDELGKEPKDMATTHHDSKYPLTFTKRPLRADVSLFDRYRRAWETAKKAAELLRESYEADRVVAFGSLADRSRFTKWSDVDLAVWGIPDRRFFAAVGAVTELSTEFKVDLVDATSCHTSLGRAIADEGVEL